MAIHAPARRWEQLSPRERQVLRFLAIHVELEGFLPSARTIASQCGLRSPSSAARIVRVLEGDGFVRCDPDHGRLAEVLLPEPTVPTLDPDDELLLAMVTAAEIDASISLDVAAVAFAPDRAAQAFVHRSALRRLDLADRYGAAVRQLQHGGARLAPRAHYALDQVRRSTMARRKLVTDWDRYCLVTGIVDRALADFLDAPRGLRRVHLQAVYEVELMVAPPDHPDLRRDWWALDPASDLGRFRDRYAELVAQTLHALRAVFPEPLGVELDRFTLLTGR